MVLVFDYKVVATGTLRNPPHVLRQVLRYYQDYYIPSYYSGLFRNKKLLNKKLDPRLGQDPGLGQDPRFLRNSLEIERDSLEAVPKPT